MSLPPVLSCEHDVECENCGTRPIEVAHNIRDEIAEWKCDHCGQVSQERVADCTEPDPDYDR